MPEVYEKLRKKAGLTKAAVQKPDRPALPRTNSSQPPRKLLIYRNADCLRWDPIRHNDQRTCSSLHFCGHIKVS